MMTKLDFVGWAIPPGKKVNTRPYKLMEQIKALGGVDENLQYYFHGRARSSGDAHNAGAVLPRIPAKRPNSRRGAILSPVFLPSIQPGSIRWIDLYDDWSIAPDINRLHRSISAVTYRWLRQNRDSRMLITCNSRYMAGKLGLPNTAIVPNGVDPELAIFPRQGEDTKRLIMLGHFFPGRTDFNLIRHIAEQRIFEEIVIGGPGKSKEMATTIEACRTHAQVRVIDWIDNREIAKLTGPQTAALIPNLVNDYTVSQDLMKVYQLLALGLRIICPSILWPSSISNAHAFLYGHGAKLTPNLLDWIEATAITDEERLAFVHAHSWQNRAAMLMRKLEALDAT